MKGSARVAGEALRVAETVSATRTRVLLVDDDPGIRFGLREFLANECGFEVTEADSCDAAVQALRTALPDLALIDFALPDGDALALLPRLREVAPDLGVVLLTGHGSVDLAVRAIKSGADHFLCKPVQLAELESILRGLARQRHLERARRAERVRRERHPVDPFAGSSRAIRALAAEAARVAESDAPTLILGPTGSGKGVLASWLHARSPRSDEPFIDINCASLSPEFLSSELFGHRRGAFTGAIADKPGLLQVAHRGTLFLDEIGDMPADIQPRLLKVLEEGRYRRLGDVDDREADVRLIAATHHDLAARVAKGEFREDLYFRVHTLPLRVPALRERLEDLPLLASRMLTTLAHDSGRPEPRLTPDMVRMLQSHDWPGNLRELHNVLERALLLSRDRELEIADLNFESRVPLAAAGLRWQPGAPLALEEVERRHIVATLEQHGGNVQSTAAALGVPRSSLYQKLQRFGIPLRGRPARLLASSGDHEV